MDLSAPVDEGPSISRLLLPFLVVYADSYVR
jgi:hypothetical protein